MIFSGIISKCNSKILKEFLQTRCVLAISLWLYEIMDSGEKQRQEWRYDTQLVCLLIYHSGKNCHLSCEFSSISLHLSLRKAYLSLLAILYNSAFKWVYPSFWPLLLASLLFLAICKASSDNHSAFLHFFFLGMVLITASYTMSRISIHIYSGTLSDLIPWIHLSLPLYNPKWFDLGDTWMV